jgi:DNA-binding GntR family transcriptional regulator
MARSSTLAEHVAAALRHAIFQGAYASGERLVELSIAQEMRVSQNTVREALHLLEQDGLVSKRARYGTHVRAFSPDEAAELYALWAALESLALEWALLHMDEYELTVLRSLLDAFHLSISQSQMRQALDLRFQFHSRLTQNAGKVLTLELLRRLYNQVHLLEASNLPYSLEDLKQLGAAYRELLKALGSSDYEEAAVMLRRCIGAGS